MLNVDGLDSQAKDSLRQEALMMCQLYHPSIARVFGFVDDGPNQALVMRYYRRGSLGRALTSLWYQDLSTRNRLKLACQARGVVLHDAARGRHNAWPALVLHPHNPKPRSCAISTWCGNLNDHVVFCVQLRASCALSTHVLLTLPAYTSPLRSGGRRPVLPA
jgi:hypothetical protein